MSFHSFAEFVSLALTVPTVVLSGLVVFKFGPRTFQYLREWRKGETPNETKLLVVGITIGFVGSSLDNIYWGLAWSASYLGLESQTFLFESGVYGNILFRQGSGILAAGLHLWAAVMLTRARHRIFLWLTILTILGAVGLLVVNRGG